MRHFKFLAAALLAGGIFFTSCSSDDDNPTPVNEEETITTVRLNFTNANDASDMATYEYSVIDGTVTQDDAIAMTTGATYNVSVEFWDLSDPDDAENITTEVIAEADEHFVTYGMASSVGLNISRASDDEQDSNGNNIGINTVWTADTAGSTEVNVTLIHEPTTVDGANGFGTTTGGSTDVDVNFDLNVQMP